MKGFLKSAKKGLILTAHSIFWLGVSLSPQIGGLSGMFYWKEQKENVLKNFENGDLYAQYRIEEDEKLNSYYNDNVLPAQEKLEKGEIKQEEFDNVKNEFQIQYDESHDLEKAIYKVGTENQIADYEKAKNYEDGSAYTTLLTPVSIGLGATAGISSFIALTTAIDIKEQRKKEESEENIEQN